MIRLPSFYFPSGFPPRILYAFLIPSMHAMCSAHFIILDLITSIMFDEAYKLWSSSILLQPPTTSSVLGPNTGHALVVQCYLPFMLLLINRPRLCPLSLLICEETFWMASEPISWMHRTTWEYVHVMTGIRAHDRIAQEAWDHVGTSIIKNHILINEIQICSSAVRDSTWIQEVLIRISACQLRYWGLIEDWGLLQSLQ